MTCRMVSKAGFSQFSSKFILVGATVFKVLLCVIHVAMSECPAGWGEYSSSCYLLQEGTYVYNTALSTCHGLGASLVEISSAEENSYVNSISNNRQIWLYCRDHITEGEFVCGDDDHAITYTAWSSPPEPNDPDGNEDCIMYHLGSWSDFNCIYGFSIICEMSAAAAVTTAQPVPTTAAVTSDQSVSSTTAVTMGEPILSAITAVTTAQPVPTTAAVTSDQSVSSTTAVITVIPISSTITALTTDQPVPTTSAVTSDQSVSSTTAVTMGVPIPSAITAVTTAQPVPSTAAVTLDQSVSSTTAVTMGEPIHSAITAVTTAQPVPTTAAVTSDQSVSPTTAVTTVMPISSTFTALTTDQPVPSDAPHRTFSGYMHRYAIKTGYCLVDHVIKDIQKTSLLRCLAYCISLANCSSMNVFPIEARCQVNGSNRTMSSSDFQKVDNCEYFEYLY